MFAKDFFDNVSNSINKILSDGGPGDVIKHAQTVHQEIQNNVQSLFQSTLEKLDIITREEFDAEVVGLENARRQLDDLAEKITELEGQVADIVKQKEGSQKKEKSGEGDKKD